MRQNLDLCKDIMFYLEENLEYGKNIKSYDLYEKFKEFDEREFIYQIELLSSKLLKSKRYDTLSDSEITFMIQGITEKGHNFLDTFRDKDLWEKTKEKGKFLETFSIDLLTNLAKECIVKGIN
ncbi:MAG: DUF2513 domain-containing protein [Arcobacteraceae bacterium]